MLCLPGQRTEGALPVLLVRKSIPRSGPCPVLPHGPLADLQILVIVLALAGWIVDHLIASQRFLDRRRSCPPRLVVIQAKDDLPHTGIVLQVLLQGSRDAKATIFAGAVDTGQRKAVRPVPVLPTHFDDGQVGQRVNGTLKNTDSLTAGFHRNSKGKPLIAAGDFTHEPLF